MIHITIVAIRNVLVHGEVNFTINFDFQTLSCHICSGTLLALFIAGKLCPECQYSGDGRGI